MSDIDGAYEEFSAYERIPITPENRAEVRDFFIRQIDRALDSGGDVRMKAQQGIAILPVAGYGNSAVRALTGEHVFALRWSTDLTMPTGYRIVKDE